MKVAADVASLGPGGRKLWDDVTAEHEVNPAELVILTEACRAKDRCDKLAAECWSPTSGVVFTVEDPDRLARHCAESLRQLIAALRLPDPVTGRRPMFKGARGVYRPR